MIQAPPSKFGLNAWAKPSAKLDCDSCRIGLQPAAAL